MTLPHGVVQLPLFMPVATQASLKGLTPHQLEQAGCRLCLNNTYHLALKPGQEVLDRVGGAHKLQGWKHNLLTDSGGYVLNPPPLLLLALQLSSWHIQSLRFHLLMFVREILVFKWLACLSWLQLEKKEFAF